MHKVQILEERLLFLNYFNYLPVCDTNSLRQTKNPTVFSLAGRKIVHLNHGSGGVMLKILTTNPNNPIHNIRILLPGYEERYKFFPFNEIFLEPLRRYSEIRFMDFLHTNGHTVGERKIRLSIFFFHYVLSNWRICILRSLTDTHKQ